MKYLTVLLEQAPEKRQVTAEVLADCKRALDHGGYDTAICAAMILAWADDEDSASKLNGFLRGTKTWPVPRSAAVCAARIREIRKGKKDYYTGLCDAVRTAKNPCELLFYANRLWGDFGKRGLEAIYEAAAILHSLHVRGTLEDWSGIQAADEFYESVMPELFRYIANTDDPKLARKALTLQDWREHDATDALSSILYCLGRGHAMREQFNFQARKRLQEIVDKAETDNTRPKK